MGLLDDWWNWRQGNAASLRDATRAGTDATMTALRGGLLDDAGREAMIGSPANWANPDNVAGGLLGVGMVASKGAKAAIDPMRAGKARMVNPGSLEFREQMQNNTAEIGRMFPPNKTMPPIVTTFEDGVETILDGHNRAAIALERGYSEMPAVTLSTKQYQNLLDAGFDDQEISYAALMRAGKKAAAAGIDKKFPGADVARRGADAFVILKKTPFE